MKSRWLLKVLWLVISVASIFLLNYYAIPGGDEMCYAFAGQNTGYILNPTRVQSFYDLIVQQWNDYHCHGNGRVLLQLINGTFSWLRLYTLFRVLNTIMWFVFVWLILKSAWREIDFYKYVVGFSFVYWFFWYAETSACNACFSLAYLWGGCFLIVMMHLWQKDARWWLVPISLIFGLTQESYVLPFLGATLGATCFRVLFVDRAIRVSCYKVVSWFLILAGACFLCFGPASRMRAGACTGSFGIANLAGALHLALQVTPVVLLLLLLLVVFKIRKIFMSVVSQELEWWMLFASGFVLWFLVCPDVYLRTGVAWFIAAMVLVLKHHKCFNFSRIMTWCLVLFSLSWLLVTAILQTKIGLRSYQALNVYKADEQGVTYYDRIRKGVFAYTCSDNLLNGWYRRLYQLEYGMDRPMTILPKNLYDSIYVDTQRFFDTSNQVATNVFSVEGFPSVYVQRGWGEVLPKLEGVPENYQCTSRLWQYLPGRLKREIDSPTRVIVPGGRVELLTLSGHKITIYDIEKTK